MAMKNNASKVVKSGVKRVLESSYGNVKKRKVEDSSSCEPVVTESSSKCSSSQPVSNKPLKPQEYSANWKAFQQVLQKSKSDNKIIPKKSHHPLKKASHVKENKQKKSASKKSQDTISLPNKEIWFDVDESIIESLATKNTSSISLVKETSFNGVTKAVGMDCEMVGTGVDGVDSILARVSIVNQFGHIILDKYVKPTEPVTDYRTHVSGIRPTDLVNGEDFTAVQKAVSDILKGRILVGHALHNDLQVLYLDHPRKALRDTSRYKPFRKLFQGRIPSLKKLSDTVLGVKVQQGEHDSVQDAQAAMRLYTMYKKEWEREIKTAKKPKTKTIVVSKAKQIKNKTISRVIS